MEVINALVKNERIKKKMNIFGDPWSPSEPC